MKIEQNLFFVLSVKNNTWSARLFSMVRSDTGSYLSRWKEVHTTCKDPRPLFDSLHKKGLMQIPNSDVVHERIRDSTLNILDGSSYDFSLTSRNGQKRYFYHCPATWSEHHPEVIEFRAVIDCIKAIYAFWELDFRICKAAPMKHDVARNDAALA
jgi:hypothetical protein